MEEKHAQLQDWGIFDEYRDIHRFYAALIIDPKSGLEALKRALFLGWYDLSEPACFTGIFNLSAEVNRYVLAAVEDKTRRGWPRPGDGMDAPLLLLNHRFFFDAQRDLPLLQAFFTEADTTLWQRVEHSAADFRGRGQMGDYWLSVLRLA